MSTDDPARATGPVAGPPAPAAAPPFSPVDEVSDPDAAVPAGPPWTLDVLADLHAGRYPAELTSRLRMQIADDPWAASVLTALDATVDDLSLLPTPRMPERFALRLDAAVANEYLSAGAGTTGIGATALGSAGERGVPQPRQAVDQSVTASPIRGQQATGSPSRPLLRPPPVSPHAGWIPQPGPSPLSVPRMPATPPGPPAGPRPGPEQWSPPSADEPSSTRRPPQVPPAALAGAPGSPTVGDHGAPVRSLDRARAQRRRWIGGLAAAAAVVAIGTATVSSLHHTGGTGSVAAPGPSAGASAGANALQLDPGRIGDALKQIEGQRPVGPLQDATTYSRCLAANSIDPSAVAGVTAANFQGKPAAAIAVVIDAGHSRVVVVGALCGINGAADQLAAQTVTR